MFLRLITLCNGFVFGKCLLISLGNLKYYTLINEHEELSNYVKYYILINEHEELLNID